MKIVHAFALLGLWVAPVAAAPPAPSAAERTAIFKAAGFSPRGAQWVRCADDPSASYTPGTIEMADLNQDGRPEAFVTESSLFCHGNTAFAFVLLTRGADGRWTKLADEVGVHKVLAAKRQGWPDIEIGGPGFGKMPVLRWTGKGYARG